MGRGRRAGAGTFALKDVLALLDLADEALRLREALRRGVQAVEHNERGDVRIDGRWTERDCIVSEMRAALAKVKP